MKMKLDSISKYMLTTKRHNICAKVALHLMLIRVIDFSSAGYRFLNINVKCRGETLKRLKRSLDISVMRRANSARLYRKLRTLSQIKNVLMQIVHVLVYRSSLLSLSYKDLYFTYMRRSHLHLLQ